MPRRSKKYPAPFVRCGVYLILVVSLCVSGSVFAEEQTTEPAALPATQEPQQLWAEVVSVDIPANQVLVKYRDFATERENELLVSIDSQTKFENVFSLEYLRPEDAVVVDYIVTAQGESLAGNIRLEGQLRWVWADVISVDAPSHQLRVSYLEEDTEIEKELIIWSNSSTIFENTPSLEGLKPGDIVNIDYVATPQGENIAKNITLQIYPEERREPPA